LAVSAEFISSFTQIRQQFQLISSSLFVKFVTCLAAFHFQLQQISFPTAANLFFNCKKSLSQLQQISLSDEARCVYRCSALGWLMKRAAFAVAA